MSLAVLADHMASKGRNGDSMLVHMTPGEVQGLQALALAHGGSLTINPETGLVEASWLKRLLPAIAGFALAPLTAGTSLAFLGATPFASALTVGAVTGLATGSLKQGIMAGLGAYGGASLGQGLVGATSAGATTAAAEAAKTAAQEAAAQQLTGEAANQFAQTAATKAYEGFAAKPFLEQATGSFGALKDAGGIAALARPALMAAAPVMADQMVQTATPMPSGSQYQGTIRPYKFDPYTKRWTAQPTYSATPVKTEAEPGGMAGGGIVALADGGALTPAEYAAKKALGQEEFGPLGTLSAAQQQELALAEARKGIGAGLSAAQIADVVNAKYNKGFTEANVRDFMLANKLISTPTPEVVTPPVTTPPVTTRGDISTMPITEPTPPVTPPASTPVPVTYGQPFTPDVPTMSAVRDAYTQGGGNIEMPNIGTVAPNERIYTQNRVVKALQDYMAANPNALYGDVAKIAKELGVPTQQLRAAMNEYRFNSMTGGSKNAYDYLMGRGAYPAAPFVPGGGPLMRPYSEVVGGESAMRRYVPTTPTPQTAQSTGTAVATAPSGLVNWRNVNTGQVVKALATEYVNDPTWVRLADSVTDTNADIVPFRKGGITSLADGGNAGVTYGTPFEQAVAGMPTSFEELRARYTPQQIQAPAPAPAPAPAAASAVPAAGFSAFSPQVQAILNRPRPTVAQETARLSVPTKDDTQARAAYEQKLASQMSEADFKGLQESPFSVLNPAFNAQVEANLRGRAELERQGIPSVFGSTFAGKVADIDPFLSALETERPMGGQITENRDLNALLNEYMTSALAGNTSRAQGAFARMNTLGLSSDSIRGMVNALDPEFNDKIYNMNFDPVTKTAKGPLGYQGFESYFAPGGGGGSGWNMIAQNKARYGYTDEDIAYGLGLSTKEVQDALASVPAQYKKWPPGNAAGGLMDIATAAARGGNVQQYNLGGYSDGGRLLRGPGDGVSDSIPATIGNRQPARLADGEFVVPARIVSEIGNGSTEAGARKLYAMMDRVQRARAKTTGKGRVAKDTKADKYLPA